jgi:hypothetical protein
LLEGVPSWSSVTIANLDQQGTPEIVVGRQAFRADGTLLWSGSGSWGQNGICFEPNSLVADVDLDGEMEVVAGPTVYNSNGGIKYRNADLPDGFVATANLDSDPQAEIVLVSSGWVYILEHDLRLVRLTPIPGGGFGGPPMIGDADGDGTPEIIVAAATQLVAFRADLSILWQSTIRDSSSSRTGATLFDFNGDGRPEVIYRDELFLRIYDGPTGQVLWQVPMSSCTWTEYVLVADIDRSVVFMCIATRLGGRPAPSGTSINTASRMSTTTVPSLPPNPPAGCCTTPTASTPPSIQHRPCPT